MDTVSLLWYHTQMSFWQEDKFIVGLFILVFAGILAGVCLCLWQERHPCIRKATVRYERRACTAVSGPQKGATCLRWETLPYYVDECVEREP